MKHPVCLGDPTSSGGVVIECQSVATHQVNGKPVAVIGDQAYCPLHLGVYPFVEGHPRRRMNGKNVVLDGHRLACGCRGVAVHAMSVNSE